MAIEKHRKKAPCFRFDLFMCYNCSREECSTFAFLGEPCRKLSDTVVAYQDVQRWPILFREFLIGHNFNCGCLGC